MLGASAVSRDRLEVLRALQDRYQSVVVLKGAATLVHDGKRALINGTEVCMQVEPEGVRYMMIYDGVVISALVLTPVGASLNHHMLDKPQPDLSRYLLSPMPGLLIELKAGEGDRVKDGEELAVVEAMKMENVLRATQDVTVKKILAQEGESLVVDQPILEFE